MIVSTMIDVIDLHILGALSANGAQTLTELVLSAVTFFLPYGLLVAEPGSIFSQEGGVYEWCK